jgi:hypothetical protein
VNELLKMDELYDFAKASKILAATLRTKLTLCMVASQLKDSKLDMPAVIAIMAKAIEFEHVFEILKTQIDEEEIRFPKAIC